MLKSRVILKVILIIIPLSIFTVAGYSQRSGFNMTRLSTSDGLSSNTVNVILKDHYGLMWFGTKDGLNKFDGTHFTTYRHNDDDPGSLPGNEILALFEDSNGRLWIGTNDGEFSYYDRVHNTFIIYKNSNTTKTNNIASVRAIYEDHLKNLWVSTYSGAVNVINAARDKTSKLYFDNVKSDLPKANVVLCFFEDHIHRMWLGTNAGLYLYNRTNGKFISFVHSDADATSISSNIIKSIAEDTAGKLWIGTYAGLNLLNDDGKSFQSFKHSTAAESISGDFIFKVAPSNDGKLWIGTDDGLNLFDYKTKKAIRIEPDPRNFYSISSKSISTIFVDKNGITWIGTFQTGINKYDQNLALFNLKQSNVFDNKGLKAPVVTSFADYKSDKIFIGTQEGGLELFNRTNGLFTQYPIKTASNEKQNALSIISLKLDRSNKLWIGTYKSGVFKLDPTTGITKQLHFGNPSPDVNKNNVICIDEDTAGNIWLGTNGNGVVLTNANNDQFKRFTNQPRGDNEFKLPLNGFISGITQAANGDVWIGSWGTGIAVFHPQTQQFTVYNKINSQLSGDYILNIFKDSKNRIWVGTSGGGLGQFDYQTKKFTTYSEKDGFSNDIIYKILEDKAGLLWLSTDYGISSFDPVTKKIRNFNQDNGIQKGSFVIGSGIRTSTNELFFGGLDGFNYFDPSTFPTTHYIPSIIFTELRLTNNVSQSQKNGLANKQLISTSEISLNYGQNFSISYAALNYTTPKQNQYSYKLTGFDKSWNNNAENSQTAYYTNLDPGNYIFNVKVRNGSGQWNDDEASIRIKILPPFWRTIYAYIFYLLSVIGLLFYLRQNSIKKIRFAFEIKQEKERSKLLLEQERREAERVHEMDVLKMKFLTNLSHEFRTPIALIMAPIDKLLSKQMDTQVSGQIKVIRRNAKRLLNLVNQLLDFRKLEEQELTVNLVQGDIVSFINDTTNSFIELADQKKIDLIFKSDIPALQLKFDHEKTERIIFNLLSNAFKFTQQGGTVMVNLALTKVTTSSRNIKLNIEVSDTGIGIPADKQEKIFERFFQHENEITILNQGSGIGLSITKEFVKLLGGTIEVKSLPGYGSKFTVTFPFELNTIEKPISETSPVVTDVQPHNEDIENNDINPLIPILLVEDNDEYRFYLKDYLRSNYKIIEATDGKEGWQKALADHPELIVCDISMPNMNGIELSKKLKADKRTSHIPIIILTATGGENNQLKGLETGANDYLTKPFNFEILNFKIKNLLMLKRIAKDTYSRQIQVKSHEIEIESSENKLINAVIDYIEDKLTDPNLSVEDLSKHIGMSRSSLYHKLLELTGMTPVEYINSIKLKKAVMLLEKSDYNITQIAYMSGFGTPGYFSRIFKAEFSLSPSQYVSLKRKEMKL